MTKLKNALILLLVVLLLAAGALLPTAVTWVQDTLTAGQVQYANVDSLQLTLEERRQSLDMVGKLNLILNGDIVEVTDKVTQMSEGDVIEAVYAGLQPYAGLGFIPLELDNDMLEFHPIMAYGDTDPDMYNFYWYVYLSFDGYADDTLTVILDDETGKILAMEFVNPYLDVADMSYEYVHIISDTYFKDLGITPADAVQIDTEGIVKESVDAVQNLGDSHAVMQFQIVDMLYGEFHIEICVHTNGFYISFP